jgi:hypothetical protein
MEKMGLWASPAANSGVNGEAELGNGGRQTGDDPAALDCMQELSVF